MKRTVIAAGVLTAMFLSSLAHAEEMQAEVYEHLKPLEWQIGEWVNEGVGPSGVQRKVTSVWEWAPHKTAIRTSFTVEDGGKVTMNGIGIIGWDAAKKAPMSNLFISNGMRLQSSLSLEREGYYTTKVTGATAEGETFGLTGSTELIDKNTIMNKLEGRGDMEFTRVQK
jgi:hypothetical protein